MKIFHNINDFQKISSPIVLTIGMYDGVHLGHQELLSELIRRAKSMDGKTVLLTFSPHPRQVLQKGIDLKMLYLLKEKIRLLEQIGLDYVIIQPFTRTFARLSATEFVRDLLINTLGMSELVIGYDHHFGRNREGSLSELSELSSLYGFRLSIVEAQKFSDITISSTKIRNALLSGEIEKANSLLNRPYTITGMVNQGDKIGRKLNFPTANLEVSGDKLIPSNGVYLFKTNYQSKKYYGLVNIGMRPTFEGNEKRIEAFLIDFTGDLYNELITLALLKKIREEQKFSSIEALKKQMAIDYRKARELIAKEL